MIDAGVSISNGDVLTWLSIATLVVAVIAAIYSARAYWLKSGLDIRGTWGIMSSIAAEDRYVHEITLENLKDRSVVIFKIFLEVGHGYFIELEDFDPEPLILKPFEAVRRRYDPIDHYSVNMRRIRMDPVLTNRRSRRRLVLATSQGRYNVTRWVDRWDPVGLFFRNYATAIVRPMRSTLDGKAYGSGTKYVVKLMNPGRDAEFIPIYARDYEVKKFVGFQLSREALESRRALEVFLLERAIEGDLRCADLEVFDLQEWRATTYGDGVAEPLDAKPRGWLAYHVGGGLVTRWENLRLWRLNRAHRREHRERLTAQKGPQQ
jgi:hypothetical protein